MAIVLSIYTDKVFREIRLPIINNTDYSISLYNKIYGFEEDIVLNLEVINDCWVFLENPIYSILKDNESYEACTLKDGDVLKLYTQTESIPILVRETTQAFHVFKKYSISHLQEITIGKETSNTVSYDYSRLVSREHAVISRTNIGWKIANKGANGICINDQLIWDEHKLEFGDFINIFGLHMMFLGEILAVEKIDDNTVIGESLAGHEYSVDKYGEQTNQQEEMQPGNQAGRPVKKYASDSRILLHRAPRNMEPISEEPIEIESPPALNKTKQQPLIMTIGPSFTMALPMLLGCLLMVSGSSSSGLTMYSGLIMALSSAVIGVVWALVSIKYQKKEEKEEELHRFEAYSRYLQQKSEEVKTKYENNIEAMQIMYQSSEACLSFLEETNHLWTRNQRHADFIYPRLGIGDIPFQCEIACAKKTFTLHEDSLDEKPRIIKENFSTLYQVPICVSLLKKKLIGLVGGEYKEGSIELVKIIATQIAAHNCYTDVKLAFIYNKQDSSNMDRWEFAKWLPHVWSEDKKIRYVASDKSEASDVLYEMAKVFRHRGETGTSKKEDIQKPYFILFLINPELMEGEIISKYVYDINMNHGLTTFILSDTQENLPNACETIIENDSRYKGIYNVMAKLDEKVEVEFDTISDEQITQFARRLSNFYVKEVETGGEIPTSLTFMEMFEANKLSDLNVLERWIKNRTYDNIKGLLGQKAGGAPCYLDLHEKYHGPHGLVAGTTGSGKSETLQTYMLALALNYSPDDIGYFIIDYKGGGMANLFNGLPHLIGQISNLSGNQVHRAMVSIKSENRRRQRVFNEYGVNNINLYTKLYKNKEAAMPIPHLFIIIDEFAELKREEPDFMRELISVAQVGRSLGVHLILATQKPSGTVDDNIWSNSKFRLCLRVQDKQDSNDMLHKPDAAYITQAGRGYLQVGNDEVFELFQSGYSGAGYEEDDTENVRTDIATIYTLTGKIDMAGSYVKLSKKEKVLYDWLNTLKEQLQAAMNNTGLALEECIEKKSLMTTLIEEMYLVFEKNGIDYANSVYNIARLEDYIKLYVRALSYGEMDEIRVLMKLASVEKAKLPQAKEKTQLDAITEYLGVMAKKNGYTHELQLWMPVLPTHLYLNQFEEFTSTCYENKTWKELKGDWELDVVVGLMDDPQNQAQLPIHVNFSEDGHLGIFGMVVSGKSTAVQTIVYGLISKYSPDYVHFYGIDFSSKMLSAFEDAPHFGGVMYEGDYEKIGKFFVMLTEILKERKKIFKGGNYSQYTQVHGVTMPAIILIIDNFSAFNEKTEERYVDQIIALSKEGVSHGIYMIITGAGVALADIPSRIAENIKQNICVQMQDKFAYGDILHTMQIDVLPEDSVKGRGLASYGGRILEYQVALAREASDDYQRLEKIGAVCVEMDENWTRKKARPIPEIPEKPVWSEFVKLEEYEKLAKSTDYIPIGYNQEDAMLYGIDLQETYCYLITGLPRSGKKNFLKVVLQAVLDKEGQVCVIDGPTKILRAYQEDARLQYTDNEENIYGFFSELLPEFVRRNKIKGELLGQDLEESEIYERMSSEQPIFIVISDFAWFLGMVYDSEYDMRGFLENIIEKGRLHNIYFIANIKLDEANEVSYRDIYTYFVSHKTGIHFGGNTGENRIFNFDSIPYNEQAQVLKPGIAYTANPMADKIQKVVIPLARR